MFRVICTCIGIILPFGLFAQQSNRSASSQPQRAQQPRQVAAPQFNEEWTSIPKTFKGDDIVALIKTLSKEKGEFESNDIYNAKLKNIANAKDKWVFVINPDTKFFYGNGYPGIEYDADKEQFDIAITIDTFQERNSFVIKTQERSSNSRIGQNSFGATARISDLHTNIYRIRLDTASINGLLKKGEHSSESILFQKSIKVPATEAAKIKNKIKLLLVMNVSPRNDALYGNQRNKLLPFSGNIYYCSDDTHSGATILSPFDHTIVNHYLNTNVISIWIYNETNGQVIEKVPISLNSNQ